MANYMQCIQSMRPNGADPMRFLVSGCDLAVQQAVMKNIIASAYASGNLLLILNNTQGTLTAGRYQAESALSGAFSVCGNLFQVGSLAQISQLRALLGDLGFTDQRAMQVIAYLNFVAETERRLGNTAPLTADTLEEYGGVMLVEWKLQALRSAGKLSEANYHYLLARYAELSAAAAEFELFLVLLRPFCGRGTPSAHTAIQFPVGEFTADKPMQRVLAKMLAACAKQYAGNVTVLMLDDGVGDRHYMLEAMQAIPPQVELHFLSKDAFTLCDADRDALTNALPLRIFTRHSNMMSCQKVEALCGQIDVVKRTSSITVDKRFKSNSAWDLLLGNNKTETLTANAPVKEARYRKEFIHSLYDGNALIQCNGNTVLYSFA